MSQARSIADLLALATSPETSEEDHKQALTELADALVSSPASQRLSYLLEQLGGSLTSSSEVHRGLGLSVITHVLQVFSPARIDAAELEALVQFASSRLHDVPCVVHTLELLLVLAGKYELPAGSATRVIRAIASEVTVQSLNQRARVSVFNLVERFLTSAREEVLALGDEFVRFFVAAMDGEKDPRNLMVCFLLAAFVLKNMDAHIDEENLVELFDITSCYFPITFAARKSTRAVSAEHLQTGLRTCFAANPRLAPHVVELLVEKIESTRESAKVDSLQTLAVCVRAYGSEVIAPHLERLLPHLMRESLQGPSEAVVRAAIEAVVAITATMCPDFIAGFLVLHMAPHWERFMQPVLELCVKEFRVPDSKLGRAHARLLANMAGASLNAFGRILQVIWPPLSQRVLEATIPATSRSALVSLVAGLLETACVTFARHAGEHTITLHPLAPFVDRISELLFFAISAPFVDTRQSGISGLCSLATVPGLGSSLGDAEPTPFLVSRELVARITQEITRLYVSDEDEAVRAVALSRLGLLAGKADDVVLEHAAQVFFNVPELNEHAAADGALSLEAALMGIRTVCCSSERILGALFPRLLAAVARHNAAESLATTLTLLRCISRIVQFTDSPAMHVLPASLIGSLVHWSMQTALRDRDAAANAEVVGVCAGIVHTIVRRLSAEEQQPLLAKAMALFLDGDTDGFQVPRVGARARPVQFRPLAEDAPVAHRQLVELLLGLVCAQRRSAAVERVEELFARLLAAIEHGADNDVHLRTLSVVVNKWPDSEALTRTIDEVLLGRVLPQANVKVAAWWLRALVMRCHGKAAEATSAYLQLLQRDDVGVECARGVDVVLRRDDQAQSGDMASIDVAFEANSSMFYQQRFFALNADTLLALGSEYQAATMAVVLMLRHIPRAALQERIDTLLPLLVSTLAADVMLDLRLSALRTTAAVMQTSITVVAPHVDQLVPTLLELSRFPDAQAVRIEAIACLEALTALPFHTLYRHKREVINGLAPALEDRKRAVRRRAVKARNEWFVLE